MRKRVLAAGFLLSALASAAAGGQPSVVGEWNLPGDQGTLQVKDDGTFVSRRADNGAEITGIWKVVVAGKITLMRSINGPGGQCDYTVTGDTLTFAHCPVAGRYTKLH